VLIWVKQLNEHEAPPTIDQSMWHCCLLVVLVHCQKKKCSQGLQYSALASMLMLLRIAAKAIESAEDQ